MKKTNMLGESGDKKNIAISSSMLLLSMAICAFAIGVTEFVTTGLLPDLASSFSISIPAAAFVTSGYALGVGVGGPLLTAATIRFPRKQTLIGLMVLFVLGSVVSAVAPTFSLLIVGRFLSAFCHGAFFGIGSVVVVSVVPENKGAAAVALMFTGLTLANVLGVPLGTLFGHQFGWRFPFWLIAGLGVLGMLGLFVYIPKKLPPSNTHLGKELAMFKRKQVWKALFVTGVGFSGLLASFAYIAPMMIHVAGFSESSVPWLMAIYGAGLVVGINLGGKAADRALMPTIYMLLILLIIALIAFSYLSHFKTPSVIILFLLGAIGFALIPPLQKNVMNHASHAPTLASSSNIAAFNLGTALGVYLGGLAIHLGFGYDSVNLVGAGLTFVALVVLFIF